MDANELRRLCSAAFTKIQGHQAFTDDAVYFLLS